MKIKTLFTVAAFGIAAGLMSVMIYHETVTPPPPIAVSYNPYTNGIFATGIVESFQPNGSNIHIYPEVSAKITQIFLQNGQHVHKGTPILALDDSIQRNIVAKDQAQIKAALENAIELKKQLEKTEKSYKINHNSISRNAVDNAIYAAKTADANVAAAVNQYQADRALLDKYLVKAPVDGTILRVAAAVGDYASPQGTYDPYTARYLPTVEMGMTTEFLQVRTYVDEILVPRLPNARNLEARLFVRGLDNYSVPITFVNLQPYAIPNIELSDERNERVDVRVLPIIFKFKKPTNIALFPGQLVDVYIKGRA